MFYATRFTMQWCTIANSETPTSKGTIVAGQGDHLTFHHNIWAHHQERTPGIFWDQVPPDNGLVDIRNNIMYDINGYSTIITGTGNVNIVNNMWKMGPNTKAAHIAWTPYFNQPLKVYDSGNCFHETDGSAFGCDSLLEKRYGPANRVSTSWPTPAVTTTSVAQAYDDLLRFAGAVPKDSMNRRVERDVRTGTGASYIIGDPKITSGPPPAADADLDGMPDFWETAMKLNPNSAADPVGDADGDGYTNVEEYLNDLALARVCRDYYNSVNPVPADWTNHDPSCAKPLPVEGNRDGKRQSAVPGFFLSKAPHIGAGPLPASLTRGAGGIQVLTSTGRVTASSQDAPGLRWQGAVSPAPGTYIIRWSDGHGRQATRKWVVPR
jgi:hypothetical protein